MTVYPIVIPYKHTPDKGMELRYALRSLKNVKNFNGVVYILGDKEKWFKNINHIPVNRVVAKPFLDQVHKLRAACLLEGIPDKFISSMDDVFIIRPTDIGVYYIGDLKAEASSLHKRSKRHTAYKLKEMGSTIRDYESHTPMLVDKGKLLNVLDMILADPHKEKLQWRSLYGNIYSIGGQLIEDKKTKNKELPKGKIISTAFYTDELDKLFPEPSEYEL